MLKLIGIATLSLAGLCVIGLCFSPMKRDRQLYDYVNGYPLFI